MSGKTDPMGTSCSLFPFHSNPKPLDSDSPNCFVYSTSYFFYFQENKIWEKISIGIPSRRACPLTTSSSSSGMAGPPWSSLTRTPSMTGPHSLPYPPQGDKHPLSTSRPLTISNTHQLSRVPLNIWHNHHHNHHHDTNNTTHNNTLPLHSGQKIIRWTEQGNIFWP